VFAPFSLGLYTIIDRWYRMKCFHKRSVRLEDSGYREKKGFWKTKQWIHNAIEQYTINIYAISIIIIVR
jgi:hypothetical protein